MGTSTNLYMLFSLFDLLLCERDKKKTKPSKNHRYGILNKEALKIYIK